MKHLPLIALCCVSLCSCVKRLVDSDIQPLSAATPQIMVHYMPWYASKPISGEWGWHWTMNHFDPDTIADDGRRAIASHYYPLIGPYDSNDPHALECHVLLMKFADIDGAIIDWYGIKDHRDYAAIHRNTNHLISYIKICSRLRTSPREKYCFVNNDRRGTPCGCPNCDLTPLTSADRGNTL